MYWCKIRCKFNRVCSIQQIKERKQFYFYRNIDEHMAESKIKEHSNVFWEIKLCCSVFILKQFHTTKFSMRYLLSYVV